MAPHFKNWTEIKNKQYFPILSDRFKSNFLIDYNKNKIHNKSEKPKKNTKKKEITTLKDPKQTKSYIEALRIQQEINEKGITRAEYARIKGCSRANVTKRLKCLKIGFKD